MQRGTVDNDGVEIAFDEAGSGRTIVWLHGMGEDRTSWTPVTDLLAGEFRSIRMDFRGHGESGRLPHYEGVDLVGDVGAVVRATCETPPIVVGHSLGGIVGTAASAFGITGPAVCIDQSLKDDPFSALMLALAQRLRDPTTFADAQLELKFALGMALLRIPMLPEEVVASTESTVRLAGETAALLSESKYDQAFSDFEQLIKMSPSTPYLHYAYGSALASASRYDEASADP